jgi:hypothetical protein
MDEEAMPLVQTLETFYASPWGEITRLRIYTPDYQRLSWLQVWQTFAETYPNRWALELYPPAGELVNDAHVYHLWLLPKDWVPSAQMNLAEKYRSSVIAA